MGSSCPGLVPDSHQLRFGAVRRKIPWRLDTSRLGGSLIGWRADTEQPAPPKRNGLRVVALVNQEVVSLHMNHAPPLLPLGTK